MYNIENLDKIETKKHTPNDKETTEFSRDLNEKRVFEIFNSHMEFWIWNIRLRNVIKRFVDLTLRDRPKY